MIADWIGSDKKRFAMLMEHFLNDEFVIEQRASWIANVVYEKQPSLIKPYLERMINKMQEERIHVAVKRHVIRILQDMDIPEHLQGIVMNICFDLLADPKETVAVRCFSMSVLDNLSKIYPELRQELVTILEDQLAQETTAGFRSRAKKILKHK